MEKGLTRDQAVKSAGIGVAETDPSDDLDGWDATVTGGGAHHRADGRRHQARAD